MLDSSEGGHGCFPGELMGDSFRATIRTLRAQDGTEHTSPVSSNG